MDQGHCPIFKGIATALVTPFKNGRIDFDTMGRLIDRQISYGVSALVICGTTGEASTLSSKEQRKCAEFAVKRVKSKIPVIVGSGSNCTKTAIERSIAAEAVGADALLIVTPYYNKASSEGVIKHYTAIADEVTVPIILYNVPSRTGLRIPLEAYKTLSSHERIVAVKEASGDLNYARKILESCEGRLDLYSGNDELIFDMLNIGALGGISVTSNLLPFEVSEICRLYLSNDTLSAQKSSLALMPIFNAMFYEVNPIPIKFAMEKVGLCSGEMRLPLCGPSAEKADRIIDVLRSYRLI